MQVYVPSIQRGRNILRFYYRDNINKSNTITNVNEYDVEKNGETIHVTKEIVSIIDNELFETEIKNNDVLFDVRETDEEVLFKFRAKDMDKLEKYLKPKSFGSNISPFSVKNRPKTKYIIPEEKIKKYKEIINKLDKKDILIIPKITRKYIKSIDKNNKIANEIKILNIKTIEYLCMINKIDGYLKYLKKEVDDYLQN